MKNLIIVFIVTFSLSIYGQKKRSPTIVILNSQETIIPTELDSLAASFIMKGLSKQEKKTIIEENGKFKLQSKKEIEFLEEKDITTNISFGLNIFLSFRFFEYFPDLLIYPAKESNQSDVKSLHAISEKHNVNWIVNIKKITFAFNDKRYSARVEFQLYNQKTKQILLEKEIDVDDSNPGLEFACEAGTISCVINNSVSQMSSEIMHIMGKDRKYWR